MIIYFSCKYLHNVIIYGIAQYNDKFDPAYQRERAFLAFDPCESAFIRVPVSYQNFGLWSVY